jgi:hypothetical protein
LFSSVSPDNGKMKTQTMDNGGNFVVFNPHRTGSMCVCMCARVLNR